MTTVATVAAPAAGRRSSGTLTVYRWELEKLTAQWRVRIVLLVCVVGPFAATLVLRSQQQTPSDTLFGRWVHVSGSAVPLLILSFVSQYAVPLLTCLVAGDIFASEDHNGTWKMILTRAPGRAAVFWGKVFAAATYTAIVMLLLVLASTAAGLLIIGHQSLVGLSGNLITAGRATDLVLLSWASAVAPAFGFTAIGILFSIVTRNGPSAIIGPVVLGGLMEVYSLVGTVEGMRIALLSSAFDAWHAFLTAQPHYGPLVHAVSTSAVYIAVCLCAGYLVLRRRDFTQG